MHEINGGKWYSEVSIDEVLRYAGVRSADDCREGLLSEAVAAVNQAGEASMPKVISRECMLSLDGIVCSIDGMKIKSQSLSAHLDGCEKVLLFAATLGSSVDRLITRYSAVRMSYAVLLQGAAAALIELYCDQECEKLEREYEKSGFFLRPRFSPGYGDFPLECQKMLSEHLSAYKFAGIAVSSGGQMIPMKSVSAVLGLSRTRKSSRGSCASGKCLACPHLDCVFRRV